MKYLRLYNESQLIKVTNDTIREIIGSEIKKFGNEVDLNHIDVSGVTRMVSIFYDSPFDGDISSWDVGNVRNMDSMFLGSQFNGDISLWNVGNVEDMNCMFLGSQFNGDISNWDVSNVHNMKEMFSNSKFNGDISNWNVYNVRNMDSMFIRSIFSGDLSKWRLRSNCSKDTMFLWSNLNYKSPWWYSMCNYFKTMDSMYESIEIYEWIDIEKKVIWRKRFKYALEDFGNLIHSDLINCPWGFKLI